MIPVHTTGAGFWQEGFGTLRAREQDSHENLVAVTQFGDIAASLTARHDSSPCADRGMNVVAFSGRARGDDGRGYDRPPQVFEEGIVGTIDTVKPHCVAFSCKDHGADAGEISPTLRSMSADQSHANGGGQVAVAFGVAESPEVAHCLRSGASKADKHESTTYVAAPCVAFGFNGDQSEKTRSMGERAENAPTLRADGPAHVATPYAVRRLTPTECERLQGFTTRIERVTISVCCDPQKESVDVVLRCLKLPSSALIAADQKSEERASSVKPFSKSDQENHGNAVVLHVQQSHEITLQKILSAGRLIYSVNGVDQLGEYLPPMPIGDIARDLAQLRQELAILARDGKEASQVSEMSFTLPANGKWFARWFGPERDENARDAELFKTEDTTFITSNHFPSFQNSELTQQIWLCSALSAIGLFIPKGTFSENFAEVVIDVESGHTLIPWRNKPADQCPDGPRYKALGNSMAVPVMAWIGKRIQLINDICNSKLN